MRVLARRGGVASGETRKMKRARRILSECASQPRGTPAPAYEDRATEAVHEVWEITRRQFALDEIAEAMRPVVHRGGSHETDWRCPECHRFNSTHSRQCGKCKRLAPENGRLTRKALRAKKKQHAIAAILAKHGV